MSSMDAPTEVAEAVVTEPGVVAGLGTRALRNTAIVLTARVASRVVALITIIATSQFLGADSFGQMQTVITYAALVNVALDLGYGVLYVRDGSRQRERLGEFLSTLLSAKVVLSIVSFFVIAALLRIPGLDGMLLPAFALMVTSNYSNLLRSSLYALQRLAYEAVAIVAESILLLGLAVWGIVNHQPMAFFIWIYVISYSCTIVYFAIALQAHHMVKFQWNCDVALLRRWLPTALAVGFTSVVTTVYFKVDVPILQQFRSYDEVGWYTLAYRPFEALLFLPFTLRNIVFPVLSVYFGARSKRLGLATEKLYRILLLFGWPCAVGLFMLAGPINHLLRLYPQSEAALRILAIGIVFSFIDNTFIAALLAMNRQNLFALVAVFGLVFNVILDFILIPTHGYLGAASATVVTEAALVGAGWWCLRREGVPLALPRLSWKILMAGALMGVALVPIREVHGVFVFGDILLGAVIYLGLLLVLRVADPEEWALLRRAVHRPGKIPGGEA